MVEKYEASAFYHPKDFERMKEEETVNFPNVCDYWADNKLSIDLREKKEKSILFVTTNRHMKDNEEIKRYSKVSYLSLKFDKGFPWKSIALKVMDTR